MGQSIRRILHLTSKQNQYMAAIQGKNASRKHFSIRVAHKMLLWRDGDVDRSCCAAAVAVVVAITCDADCGNKSQ